MAGLHPNFPWRGGAGNGVSWCAHTTGCLLVFVPRCAPRRGAGSRQDADASYLRGGVTRILEDARVRTVPGPVMAR